MRSGIANIMWPAIFYGMFFLCWGECLAGETKRVFFVASYEENHVCGGPQDAGAIDGLAKEGWFVGINLEIERYYMDTKRRHTTTSAMKKQGEIALKKIKAFQPEVVVVIDDNAFREVGLALSGQKNISVVFTGMNGQPEAYNQQKKYLNSRQKPGGNITGVYEKLYVHRALKVMKMAAGKGRGHKVVGITDFSPTGNALTRQFEIELKQPPEGIKWELKRVRDWQEYTKLIISLNSDPEIMAIYPVALTLKVDSKTTYTAPEIFRWTVNNSRKPEMALNYFFSKMGLFGSAAVDFRKMGFLAGKMAGMILNNESPAKIPIADAPDYAIVFNTKRAIQLGIEIPMPLLTAADEIFK